MKVGRGNERSKRRQKGIGKLKYLKKLPAEKKRERKWSSERERES